MRRLIAVAVALVLAGSATTLALRKESARSNSSEIDASVGGDVHPYDSPRRVTPGEYRPPVVFASGADERGQRLQREDNAKPGFEGYVNGIYLWSSRAPDDPALGKRPCPLSEAQGVPEDQQSAKELYLPVPSYLPPGAYEYTPPQMLICPNGRVAHVGRDFQLRPYGGDIGISRIVALTAAEIGRVPSSRVSPASVNGKPAAFVRPISDEGFGNGWIIVRESFGLTQISSSDLPFDELLKVAKAVIDR
jgi:hypothetical protein